MKRIVLDFLRRWWWMIALCGLLTLTSVTVGGQILCAALIYLAMNTDGMRGGLRAMCTLPITRKDQALVLWFIGVALLPLISLTILPMGVMLDLPARMTKLSEGTWFAALGGWWLELGCGAILFMMLTFARHQPAVSFRGKIEQAMLVLPLSVAMLIGVRYVYPLPSSWAEIATFHGVAYALVPFAVAGSIRASSSFVARKLGATVEMPGPEESGKARMNSRMLTGLPLLVAKMHSLSVTLYVLIVITTWAIAWFVKRPEVAGHMQTSDQQAFMFAVIMGGCMLPNQMNLRMMRMMPMSSVKLTALLISVPAAIGFASMFFTIFFGKLTYPDLSLFANCITKFAFVTGAGALAVAFGFCLRPALSFVAIFLVTGICAFSFDVLPRFSPAWPISIGVVGSILSFLWLNRTLQVCSWAYQPRRLFGMSLDQLSQGR